MTEQIASGFVLVAGLFIVAAVAGYVLLNRLPPDHHKPPRIPPRSHGEPMLRG